MNNPIKTTFKTAIAGAIGGAMLLGATPTLANDRDGNNRYEQSDRHDSRYEKRDSHGQRVAVAAHRFKKGERFDRRKATNYRVVSYRDYRGRRAPPRGYQYVRSGNDILLIGITSGIVSSVISGLIR